MDRSYERKRSIVRSTSAQIKLLIDYMSTHVDFANNEGEYANPLIGNKKKDMEWFKLKMMLRKHGPDKSIEQWKCSWRDLKKKARDEIKRIQTENSEQIPELSKRDIKILNTIGFDNVVADNDESVNCESRDSNDATNEEMNISDGTNKIEFVASYNKTKKDRESVHKDEEDQNDEDHLSFENASDKEYYENEFENAFKSRRRKVEDSIELGQEADDADADAQSEADEYSTFGLLVSQKIRKLNSRHRLVAQQRIIQILFDIEMDEIKKQ